MSRRTEKEDMVSIINLMSCMQILEKIHMASGRNRMGIIISCDASNHDGAPQVSVVPLSSKLKDIPVHVILNPKDVSGFGLSKNL